MDREESLWEAIRTLWIKYCGISDEYKILKHRWQYLHSPDSLPVLPPLFEKNEQEGELSTFDRLDNLVSDINDTFNRKLNFRRVEHEDYTESLHYLQTFSLREYYILERKFFELSNFVGLLKSAFFQRTVSAEIPHVASGLPHSPERTIGNELFYLAADEVAKSYCKCFKIPYGKWDGFITFTPPITEGHFTGAFFRPSEYSKLFHISMSEEQKYFVGAYMLIAHELGHAPVVKLRRELDFSWTDLTSSFKRLSLDIYNDTMSILKGYRYSQCEECPLNRTPLGVYNLQVEQCVADILGLRAGGPNIGHAFLDTAFGVFGTLSKLQPTELDLIRVLTLRSYMIASGLPGDEILGKRIEDLEDRVRINRVNRNLDDCLNFSDCIERIGFSWAFRINDFNLRFPRDFADILNNSNDIIQLLALCPHAPIIDINIISSRDDWGNLQDICETIAANEGVELNCSHMCMGGTSDSLFSHFVVNEFSEDNIKDINGETVTIEDIKDALSDGVPCPEIDPRYILHAYYECYKDSRGIKRPHYAATIHSLAFNKFNRKKKRE